MEVTRRAALAGLGLIMALKPDTSAFSQFLRLAFFRSPNYVAGVSGWTINVDGSAEFNNLTIRGTFKGTNFIINASGLFIYSGTPALGNLIGSWTSASGTDSFGNTYLRGLSIGSNLNILPPSGDATGATDAAAINAAVASGGTAMLSTGTYTINATLSLGTNSSLLGSGPGTIIVPAAGFTGPMVSLTGTDMLVTSLQFYGGSTTRSANPAAHVISVASAAARWWVNRVTFRFCNGRIIFGTTLGAGSHGLISDILAIHNASGLDLESTAQNAVQIDISNLDMQQFEVGDAVKLVNLTDIAITNANFACQGAAGIPLHITGSAASIYLANADIGQFPNTGANIPTQPTVLIEDSGGNSPNDISLSNGVIQQGVVGMRITGGATRVAVTDLRIVLNQGAGLDMQGTGFGHDIASCHFSSNGQVAAGGAAAEITWSGAAAGRVHHNRFDTPQGATTGHVANVATFTGGGTQVFDDNWIGGAGFTTANTFGTAPVAVSRNQGFNPVGSAIPLGTPGVPLSGNSTGPRAVDCQVRITAGTSTCTIAVGGVTLVTIAAAAILVFRVPRTQTVTLTYTNAPTWVWIGE